MRFKKEGARERENKNIRDEVGGIRGSEKEKERESKLNIGRGRSVAESNP